MLFVCNWCKSKYKIDVIEKGEKGTIPTLEYCSVCGMSEEMIKSVREDNG